MSDEVFGIITEVMEALDKLDIPSMKVFDKLSAKALSVTLLNMLKLSD